jgi:hypothetical protein
MWTEASRTLSNLHTCGVTNSAGMHMARVRKFNLTANFRRPSTEHSFLGAFAKLRKATINFIMSVCYSVRIEQLCSKRTDFHEIWCVFLNVSRTFKLHTTLTIIMGTGHEEQYTFMIISRWILLRIKKVLGEFVEKANRHFVFSKNVFPNNLRFMI